AVMMADAENSSNWTHPKQHHWAQAEWRSFVTPDSNCSLLYWKPGTELMEVHSMNHLAGPHVRFAQWLVHRFLLRILDRRRTDWPLSAYPQKIPGELVARLQDELQTA